MLLELQKQHSYRGKKLDKLEKTQKTKTDADASLTFRDVMDFDRVCVGPVNVLWAKIGYILF